jgi:hypothetical protein
LDTPTSLITESAKALLLQQLSDLGTNIDAHINGGLEQHDTQVIVDVPFLDSNGDEVSDKTLKIGIQLNDSTYAYVLVPAISE